MGLKHNLVNFKHFWWGLFIKSWTSSHHLHDGKRYNGNPISTMRQKLDWVGPDGEKEEEEKSPVCAVLPGLPSSPLNFAECQYPGLGTGP